MASPECQESLRVPNSQYGDDEYQAIAQLRDGIGGCVSDGNVPGHGAPGRLLGRARGPCEQILERDAAAPDARCLRTEQAGDDAQVVVMGEADGGPEALREVGQLRLPSLADQAGPVPFVQGEDEGRRARLA